MERFKYNSAPGHGLMSKTAHELRMDFLKPLLKIRNILLHQS